MAATLRQSEIEAFIQDPVLAAWAIFGVELDVFQRVRLRMMWWIPELIDDSGISTGKTEILWLWAQLRCILLPQPKPFPHRIVGIFYPTLPSAEKNFKPKYEKYIETSPVFRGELMPMRGGGLGFQKLEGALAWNYRNGSSVVCPAPGFAQDAKGLASFRCHDGGVDEAKEIDAGSEGLDKQVLGRVTAPAWNSNHPVHANHIVLMGHAEDPATHPFYRRVLAFRELIRDGSQDYGIITSCYLDWTERFQKSYRPDKAIRRDKLINSTAAFRQKWCGIWEHGTEDWYDTKALKACRSRHAPILTARTDEKEIFAMGDDTAPGANVRSDLNAKFIWRARRLPDHHRAVSGVFHGARGQWEISPVWATEFRGRDTGKIAGIIHRAHQRFHLRRIVFDPQGGGSWVLKELWKPEQEIDGIRRRVTGLCTVEAAHLYPAALPLLVPFSHGSYELAHVWGEDRFRKSGEGIIEAMHRIMQGLVASQSIVWPAFADERSPAELAAMDAEQRQALAALETACRQLASIKVVIGSDKEPKLTKAGFLMFRAEGKRKKDLAYAALYGLMGLLSILLDPEWQEQDESDSDCMAMA